MIRAKINLDRVDKSALFKGAKGTYLDLCVWENRNGVDEYGNSHYVTQDLGKARREAGDKAPILGNGKSSIVPAKKPTPKPDVHTHMNDDSDQTPF